MQSKFSTLAPQLFNKILIANRGEIACRIIRTCKKLGIATVAIHSDIDYNSLYCRMADERYCVGPAPSIKSYLNQQNILKACLDTNSQAVHPGYGFLSENTSFVKLLETNNIQFIGPNSKSMSLMGDKLASKALAKKAGVDPIPGFKEAILDEKHAVEIANSIGYPVMIKPSCGGGGKGMRIARNDKECMSYYQLSKNEAESCFDDSRILIEKFIENPRHIEVQIIGDKFKNYLYFPERECSIQRRMQKIIEESPSTFIDPETRKKMGEQAVSLAKHAGYSSAGTIEFLVDKDRKFYFLEMNTRLQVEHCVTEIISGLDLVELMIKVAANSRLPLSQNDLSIQGWGVEGRLYAENPLNNFLPSSGTISNYKPPDGTGIRVDSGIEDYSSVPIYYDPILAKVVAHGKDRKEAIDRLQNAFDKFVIQGVQTNIPFLSSLLHHPLFMSGDISTDFIPLQYPKGFQSLSFQSIHENTQKSLLSCAIFVFLRDSQQSLSLEQQQTSSILFYSQLILQHISPYDYQIIKEFKVDLQSFENIKEGKGLSFEIEFHDDNNKKAVDSFQATIDSSIIHLTHVSSTSQNYFQLVSYDKRNMIIRLQYQGSEFLFRVLNPVESRIYPFLPIPQKDSIFNKIISPMPGALFDIMVEEGQEVQLDQEICIVESMKMQNILRSPNAGKIKKIFYSKGDNLPFNTVIAEIE